MEFVNKNQFDMIDIAKYNNLKYLKVTNQFNVILADLNDCKYESLLLVGHTLEINGTPCIIQRW